MDIIIKQENNLTYAYFNGLKFRKTDNYWDCTKKACYRLHVAVWEYHNGKVPENYHIP